jgi:small subunit ribosomal protein S17
MTNETNKKNKSLRGEVVSDAMDKTVVVRVQRFVKHPKYGKFIKVSKRYKAHDAENAYHIGDKVVIEEVRPISKDKSFSVVATY